MVILHCSHFLSVYAAFARKLEVNAEQPIMKDFLRLYAHFEFLVKTNFYLLYFKNFAIFLFSHNSVNLNKFSAILIFFIFYSHFFTFIHHLCSSPHL